jgi:hypothetical protein
MRARRLRGFALPMTIVLVFALAALSGAVVVSVTALARNAQAAEQALLLRISLESAVETAADAWRRTGSVPTAPAVVNGRSIAVAATNPLDKLDLNEDPAELIVAAAQSAGLDAPARAHLERALEGRAEDEVRFSAYAEFVTATGLNSGDEDCLRRVTTLGRWPAPLSAETTERLQAGAEAATSPPADRASAADGKPPAAPPRPGDQLELRAEAAALRGGAAVLWTRLRYTGEKSVPWAAHEWRFLQLAAGARCAAHA